MRRYILRRLSLVPILLLGITLMTFFMFNLAPGDPVTALIKPGQLDGFGQGQGANLEMLRAKYGLDKPVYVRYLDLAARTAEGQPRLFLRYRSTRA